MNEHYDEVKATLQGLHEFMESLSAIERRLGPAGSHARGYTHKITAALRHLDALVAEATQPPQDERGQGWLMQSDAPMGQEVQALHCDGSILVDAIRQSDDDWWWRGKFFSPDDIAGYLPISAEPAPPVALSTLTDECSLKEALQYGVDIHTPGRVDGPTYHHVAQFLIKANTALAASATAQQAAPVKLTRYDRDEGGMFPSESGDWVLYEKLAEQMATPPQPVAAEVANRLRDTLMMLRNHTSMSLNQIEMIDAAISGTGSDESKKGEA